jgi:NADH dehydrogenase
MQARKLATVFGGTGFIGRYVVKRLAALGYIVRVATRDTESAMVLRPMGGVGQIVPLYAPLGAEALVARAMAGAEVVVNLTGILAESGRQSFARVHAEGPAQLARLAAGLGVAHFVHVSAIGADATSPSAYARSKAAGEAAIRTAYPAAVLLRPSIVFGAEDSFFNRFATMATLSPVVPVVGGTTKFQPVYVGDVADAVIAALRPEAAGKTYELGGPDVKSFKELIEYMLKIIERDRLVLDLPLPLATLQASVLEHLPGKLLTRDQVKLLGRDNVVAPASLTLTDLGLVPHSMDLILPAYLARYRPGGRRREAAFSQ